MAVKQARGTKAYSTMPVFYDASGKRLKRFILSVFVLCLCVLTVVIVVTPYALAPLWRVPAHGSNDFPRQFLAKANLNDLPIIGDATLGILNRIVKVDRHSDGSIALVDPFSGEVYRTVTDDNEKEQIGDSPYALDNFGRPADHVLMLTFDDGPDAKYTPELLDLLAKEHVQATFFTIGESIVENPDVFQRMIREGHMVGNHTMTHTTFSEEKDYWNREELIATDRIMRATANYATRLFRNPKGDPDSNALAVLQAQQLGYIHVDMDLDTRDWEKEQKPGVILPVPPLDGSGHVVLMHDGGGNRSATLDLVAKLIKTAKSQGYTFSTIAPMLPPEYIPVRGVTPTLSDVVTLHTFQIGWTMLSSVLTCLFWFGVVTLSVMSLLYLVLTILVRHQTRQRRWPDRLDEKLPYVSVVLAAYNEEKVIAKTIESLRNSDYPKLGYEVIVVNDGSTDGTREILRQCAIDWQSHLAVITVPNGGKSAAINRGVREALGEIVVTMDADTIFRPDTMRLLVRHFAQTHHDGKQVGAVAGHVKVGNRRNILTWWQSLEYISGICVTRVAEGALGAISIVPGACSAWRRSALLEIGGFSDRTMAEDADATLMLQRRGYRVLQEDGAIAETEAPETIKALAKQRKRWTYGNIQALWKHRSMLLRPKYGMLGMVTLPYAFLSLLIPLLFLPLTAVVAVMSLTEGNWTSVAIFAAFVMTIHAAISMVALVTSHESMKHMLVVPIYRLIYEPLRAYLLYASLFRVIKGTIVKWDKLERTNNVLIPVVKPAVIPL